jgi:hypothetical protein
MTGLRFGMLTVIEAAGNTTKGLALWKCRCDCGKFVIHPGTVLRGQRAYSCGCTKRPKDWEHIPANGVRYGLDYLRGVLQNQDGKTADNDGNNNSSVANSSFAGASGTFEGDSNSDSNSDSDNDNDSDSNNDSNSDV